MNEHDKNLEKIRSLLQRAVPPAKDTPLQRDLWPAMRQRLAEPPPAIRLPWWDWALLAAAGLLILLFPSMIPALLYHL
jgi:hypothetical protein